MKSVLLLLAILSLNMFANVSVPHVFGNDMVLQREKPIPVWGWAEPGEKVVVAFADASVETVADSEGNWKVALPAAKAGGPFSLSITGKNTVTLSNVMVGEVWVCSGQSNMEMPLNNMNGREAMWKDANFPNIRLFLINHRGAGTPQTDCNNTWHVCNSDTVRPFSTAGYYFGRELHLQLGVPIGLIEAAVGGSRIEPWIPYEGFTAVPEFTETVKEIDRANEKYAKDYGSAIERMEAFLPRAKSAFANQKRLPQFPEFHHDMDPMSYSASMYNGMIAPVVQYGIRGAIWYQGESNRSDGKLYTRRMEALIKGWRAVWNQGDFPVYYVQIAPYHYDEKNLLLPEFWEAQSAALKIPNTGMVVTTDIGNLADIHPQKKVELGRRLGLVALGKTYGKDIVYSGPVYKESKVEGNKIRISFEQPAQGLVARDGAALNWFTIAGADKKFVPATAIIDGDTVLVSSEAVAQPAIVRFAWDQEAEPNLVNKAGLPTAPFRTGE